MYTIYGPLGTVAWALAKRHPARLPVDVLRNHGLGYQATAYNNPKASKHYPVPLSTSIWHMCVYIYIRYREREREIYIYIYGIYIYIYVIEICIYIYISLVHVHIHR